MPDTVFLAPYLPCLLIVYIQEAMIRRKTQTKTPPLVEPHFK